jgi:hypothetical protein
MQNIVTTQAFSQFTLARVIQSADSDFETIFIDEHLEGRYSRAARMKFGKSQTPFLSDKSFHVNMTIQCLKPVPLLITDDDIPHDQNAEQIDTSSWPHTFNPALFGIPRHVQPLHSESDHTMLRTHASELIQRSRISNVHSNINQI